MIPRFLVLGSSIALSTALFGLATACSGSAPTESVTEASESLTAGHSVVQIVDSRDPAHPCSGASLTDRWVLTSTSCVRDGKGVANAGSLRVSGNGRTADGLELVFTTESSELALLHLQTSLPFSSYPSIGGPQMVAGEQLRCAQASTGAPTEAVFPVEITSGAQRTGAGYDFGTHTGEPSWWQYTGGGCFRGDALVGLIAWSYGGPQTDWQTTWITQTVAGVRVHP